MRRVGLFFFGSLILSPTCKAERDAVIGGKWQLSKFDSEGRPKW